MQLAEFYPTAAPQYDKMPGFVANFARISWPDLPALIFPGLCELSDKRPEGVTAMNDTRIEFPLRNASRDQKTQGKSSCDPHARMTDRVTDA